MQVDWGQVGIGAGGIRWGIGKEEEIRKRQLDLGDIWVAACTSRSGHFLESIRITLMRTPSNSRNSLNWPSFFIQASLPTVGLGYIWLSFWSRRSHGDPYTTEANAGTEGYPLKTNREALLLTTTSTQLTEQREVELVPACSLHPSILVSGMRKCSAGYG